MEASEGVVSQSGLCVIAQPVCNEKLAGRALKLVRKGSKIKAIRRGVKEIHKAFRKKEAGILILAGNVSPIDVLSHFPPLAEEHDIPYAFVNSKEELGMYFVTFFLYYSTSFACKIVFFFKRC